MLSHTITKAKSALGSLCEFVGSQRWTVPWTRLVLYDVFVRTVMMYGAPAWAPQYLEGASAPNTRTPLGQLSVTYRQGLRTLLHIPRDIRVEALYVLTLRWPVEVALAKATWRYYTRV
jgi:hypothetical protein